MIAWIKEAFDRLFPEVKMIEFNESKHKICDECGGSGLDFIAGPCGDCDGNGFVYKKMEDKINNVINYKNAKK